MNKLLFAATFILAALCVAVVIDPDALRVWDCGTAAADGAPARIVAACKHVAE
ncbi:MAG: hypothetical protein LBU11_12385 [Zoogloeaceae bacterium]|jgi:hypothetical protein|nr:hypothetical protein [Zoogloeaceae bacterium]